MPNKTLLRLIREIDLSTMLAIESLAPWESVNPDGYCDGTLHVLITQDDHGIQRRSLLRHNVVAEIMATEEKGNIVWTRGPTPVWYPALRAAVRACGGKDGGAAEPGTTLLRIDADELANRIGQIFNAMYVMRFLTSAGAPEADVLHDAAALLDTANRWQALRLEMLQKGDSRESGHRRSELMREMAYDRCAIRTRMDIKPQHDPRGSAFVISNEDRMPGRELHVMPARLDWVAGQELDVRAAPKRETNTQAKRLSSTAIDDAVHRAISQACLQPFPGGWAITLAGQLAPKDYKAVARLLADLGGAWHTGKKAHVFREDPTADIEQIVAKRTVHTARDYEFFPTAAPLVEEMLDELPIRPGMVALEPNAGDGAIAKALASRLGSTQAVTCYELWPKKVDALRALGFAVDRPEDFLTIAPPRRGYDLVVMNPPFSGSRDVLHITHALKFVAPGGWLSAISSVNWQNHETAPNRRFRILLHELGAKVVEVPPGAFAHAGTNVATLRILVQRPVQQNKQTAIELAPELFF